MTAKGTSDDPIYEGPPVAYTQDAPSTPGIPLGSAFKPLIPPSAGDPRLQLWKLLFATLGAIAVILAVGAVWLLVVGKDTGAAICLVPVSAIIAGLVGLFSQGPS